ncbi:activator of (r)-2-hydroxyglutaryl-coa dehydratase domain protein [Heliomicrobium modesticaldum Ice1]|uniref:Activator of (R)-2-hydroxyglutaryl-coa dehydratase domain protein n=1 Tax=Heliobacterium modesticaldum (strain ATCC 51547 / Ice1) TaxID=498761 RepID=B0TFI0_HELMI|nr:acyl-CoA dehydratase activase [Heliomicrobium modesticaldum]ABZ83079.1 activator of (r)-2-hydroxyglutaryl-coa dehydratase domain protein [Heliomicrobium modesticaldum Ice1]
MKIGLDLGSRYVKAVFMEDGRLVDYRCYDTLAFYREYGRKVDGELVVDYERLGWPTGAAITSTGYGRNLVKLAGGQVIPELRAHTRGAIFQTGLSDFTLLDLGGQDSKVIKVAGGRMVDFRTNDKCAASSGRYLENMAAVLAMDVAALGECRDEPVELSSTCAVFGESELIGQIIEGHPIEHLAAGVNRTIVKRVEPMLRELYSPVVVFTGGVARNQAIRAMLEDALPVQVILPAYPQLNGAIGCAV